MKLDAMTLGAVGFAAFAAWQTLKKPKTGQATAATGADVAYAQAAAQRRDVGNNIYQNTDWILTNVGIPGFVPNVNGVPRTGTYTPWEG
jgi:hypothetical protein